jgi:flagellar biosynthesis chaperone FliJ
MTRHSPLATLLRVRRLQQDLARAEVATAQAAAALAELREQEREEILSRHAPVDGDPRAFLASLATGRALAAEASAARRVRLAAQSTVQQRITDYTAASGRAEGVERVVSRHEADSRAAEARAEAAERDDLSAAAHARRRRAAQAGPPAADTRTEQADGEER